MNLRTVALGVLTATLLAGCDGGGDEAPATSSSAEASTFTFGANTAEAKEECFKLLDERMSHSTGARSAPLFKGADGIYRSIPAGAKASYFVSETTVTPPHSTPPVGYYTILGAYQIKQGDHLGAYGKFRCTLTEDEHGVIDGGASLNGD